MSLKTTIAPALHSLALTTGVSTALSKALRVGRIIAFHGIGDGAYPAAALESQLKWLAKHFQIVSLDTMLMRLATGLSNEVVLTFDDGLRNNLVHAYPLLKQFNAPATFFVVPGLVENGRWLWTHEARARLAALPASRRNELFKDAGSQSNDQVLQRMKDLATEKRREAEDRLRGVTPDFKPSTAQSSHYDLMSWEELRQLDPRLITIGSHSLTHPILSNLSNVELVVEMFESRRMLENRLQRAVEFFCYPNGSHNADAVQVARQNYRAAVCNEGAFVTPGADLHQLPRIGATPRQTLLAWRMHRPGA